MHTFSAYQWQLSCWLSDNCLPGDFSLAAIILLLDAIQIKQAIKGRERNKTNERKNQTVLKYNRI